MPTIQPHSRVLVTGANGYIAFWVVRYLLEFGYRVRGSVRSEEKARYLMEYFLKRGYGPEVFEVVIVEDISIEGAFDEAVKDVDAIVHTASPFVFNLDDPKDLIGPAVDGTLGVLHSAMNYGDSVKRTVITSSCAAVLEVKPQPTVFSESNWNEFSVRQVEEKGRLASAADKYRASKTLAERAAWEFIEENKGEIEWDLSVINPPFVFGPAIHEVNGPANLNTSLKGWYDNVVAGGPEKRMKEVLYNIPAAWVDVRDVALAHVLALQTEEAGGERIIISKDSFVWQDWLDLVNEMKPYPLPNHLPDIGIPGQERTYLIQYDTSKAQRIFGIKMKTKAESAKDMLEDFRLRGW